jgi:hypothetical protein
MNHNSHYLPNIPYQNKQKIHVIQQPNHSHLLHSNRNQIFPTQSIICIICNYPYNSIIHKRQCNNIDQQQTRPIPQYVKKVFPIQNPNQNPNQNIESESINVKIKPISNNQMKQIKQTTFQSSINLQSIQDIIELVQKQDQIINLLSINTYKDTQILPNILLQSKNAENIAVNAENAENIVENVGNIAVNAENAENTGNAGNIEENAADVADVADVVDVADVADVGNNEENIKTKEEDYLLIFEDDNNNNKNLTNNEEIEDIVNENDNTIESIGSIGSIGSILNKNDKDYWNFIGLVEDPNKIEDNLFNDLIELTKVKKKVEKKTKTNNEIENTFSYYQFLDSNEVYFIQSLKNIHLPISKSNDEEKPILIHIGSPFHIGFWKLQNADHPINEYKSICYLNELSEQENLSIVVDNQFDYICYNDTNKIQTHQLHQLHQLQELSKFDRMLYNTKANNFIKTKTSKIHSHVYIKWDQICHLFNYPNDSRIINQHNLFFIILLDILETNVQKITFYAENFTALFSIVEGERNILPQYAYISNYIDTNDDSYEELTKKIHILRWLYIRDNRIQLNETLDRELLQMYDLYVEHQIKENKKIRLYQYQPTFWNLFKKSIEMIQIRNPNNKNNYKVRYIPFSIIDKYMIHERSSISFTNSNEIILIYQDKPISYSIFIQWIQYYRSQIQNNLLNHTYHNVFYLVNDYSLFQNAIGSYSSLNPQDMNDMIGDNGHSVQKIIYIMQNKTWDEIIETKMQKFFKTRKMINSNLKWLMYIYCSYSSYFINNTIHIEKEIFENLPEYEKLFYFYMCRRKYFTFATMTHYSLIRI